MLANLPPGIPAPHRHFMERLSQLRADDRIVGVAAGGSFLTNAMDEFSDLDVVIAAEPSAYPNVMRDRPVIAASLGCLLTSYTGEHQGDPRLFICLYGEPLLLVDFTFVSLDEASNRTENPSVLWDKTGRLAQALGRRDCKFPAPDHDWIENRFWVWVYFICLKIGRGELFEAINFLAFLRSKVLGPLGLERAGARLVGVRRIEMLAPEFARELRRTVARHDAIECLSALRASVELYQTLRSAWSNVAVHRAAETAAIEYLEAVEARHGL